MTGRTLKAFVPALAAPDDAFARGHLSPQEWELYVRMDRRDRDHACRVARAVLTEVINPSPQLIRAALLHDIGKSGQRYNPLERVLVHLYTPQTMPQTPQLTGVRGAWQRNAHHALLGAARIRRTGGCERVAQLVALHHTPNGDVEAEQLKRIEELF